MSANFPLIVVLVLSIIWLWHMSKLSTICLTCANFPLVVGIVPQVVGSVLMLFCWWDICLLSSAYLFTCFLVAKLSSSSSSSLVELSTALILIISTHPTPTHPRDSSNDTLLDFLGR